MRGAAVPARKARAASGSAARAGISYGCAILALRDTAIIDDLEPVTGYSTVTNQVLGGPSYDANGNQLTSTPANLTWNALNLPISVNSTTATYDALGRMVEKGSGGAYTQFVFSPAGTLLALYSGGLVKGTIPLPGGGTAIYNGSGLNYIRHTDWLGSSRLATYWNHTVYSKEAYAPFGETYNEAGTPDRSFTGQDQDVVTGSGGTGVYDFLFRKYDPSAGRWLSPDPAGWGAVSLHDPQSFDRYAYVENQPMNATDPEGLTWCISSDGFTEVQTALDTCGQPGSGWTKLSDYLLTLNVLQCADCIDNLGGWVIWWFGYGGYGGYGSGSGGGGAPNNTQQTKDCLSQFSNSATGKAVQFFSLYNLATNFKSAWADWTLLPGAKIALLGAIKGVSNQIGGTEFWSITSGASAPAAQVPGAVVIEAGEAAGAAMGPATIATATGADMLVSSTCSGHPISNQAMFGYF